jgi:AcrR family transcriptional regulator
MARPRLHDDDTILDAARDLLVTGGPEATTTAAISSASGAPVGSLYHRFGSRAQLFAEVWMRTVSRFQAGLIAAASNGSPLERALAAADWTIEFAVRHPDDTRLLLQARREELFAEGAAGAGGELPAHLRQSLATLNQPVATLFGGLAADLFGTATPEQMELLTIAVIDVPYAIVRRHLGLRSTSQIHRDLVATTVRTLLKAAGTSDDPGPSRTG